MILRSIIADMPKVSRIKLDPHRSKTILNRFWDAITLIENKSETIPFLKDLLTPIEQIMLAKRLSIALMLKQGYNYEQISAYLKTTPGTIASVNRSLNFGNFGYLKILQRIHKLELEKQKKLESIGEVKAWRTPVMDTTFLVAKAIEGQIKKSKKIKSVKSL
jgi:TrpR-related protein YerC/YecD